MRTILTLLAIFSFSIFTACGSMFKAEETHLQVEVVDVPIPGVNTDSNGSGGEEQEEDDEDYHELFDLEPGTWVKMSSFAGIIDPVGTALPDDFDGDAIDNDQETASNVWVADYPLIETSVSPPITMQIEIWDSSHTNTEEIGSEITSDDVESTKDYSTEAEHRNEVNLRTVQYQDSYNKSVSDSSDIESSYSRETSTSKSKSKSGSISVKGFGGGGSKSSSSSSSSSYSRSSKVARSHESAYGETKTKWKDVPFKNNTNSNGWAQKSNEASRNARQMRSELRTATEQSYEIKPDAGYIRAALYITNETVNIPVKIRDILCSFMFQSGDGQLIPVQSFRLRNDDYSIFEIELYGDTTFGPYVIELKNLNTLEVKEAIAKGYNPKIFIIDYKMRHVEDSNYRDLLSANFTGDNLKIIEENAKGRTAGVKIVAPGLREFYRVVAFDTDGEESRTDSTGAVNVSPGVSLEKALRRISYSGTDIQFANYVIDMSGMMPEMDIPRFLVRGVKSVNGIETRLPVPVDSNDDPIETVIGQTVTKDEDGAVIGTGEEITAYLMKPVDDWTDEEANTMRVWGVYYDGRYYFHVADKVQIQGETINYEYFEYELNGVNYSVPKVMGIESIIWPGDHYDITCVDLAEYFDVQERFGTNPFETGETITFNTRWNLSDLGEQHSYFYPDNNSIFLGEACPGDVIEFKVCLKSTKYLNPDFGDAVVDGSSDVYSDFGFDFETSEQKFTMEQALGLEINFGLGGEFSDWINLIPGRSQFFYYLDESDTPVYAVNEIDRNWNFLKQEFSIWLQMPLSLKGVPPAGAVKVYMRTALNSAFRESIWPVPYAEVKKFTGTIAATVSEDYSISISNAVGTIESGDILNIASAESSQTFTVSAVTDLGENKYTITVQEEIITTLNKGDKAYINLDDALTSPEIAISVDQGFANEWNNVLPAEWYNDEDYDEYAPLMYGTPQEYNPMTDMGFVTDETIANWLGNYNYSNPNWNQWADASFFYSFLDGLLDVSLPDATTGMRVVAVDPEITNGLNNFFIAPLIERNYEVTVIISE